MSSAFSFNGGAADKIRAKITTSTPADVAGSDTYRVPVTWFQVNEVGGGTPTLTVAVYNALTGVVTYLGDGTSAWVAKAMTAKQSVSFLQGFVLEKSEYLRITINAGAVDVFGLASLGNE